MIGRRSACDRHRAVLTDFIDRHERGPRTDDALDHLSRCDGCEREMTELALTIAALRRLGRGVAAAEPRAGVPAVGSNRLARVGPWWPFRRSALAGPVLSLLVVALVILPSWRSVPAAVPTAVDAVGPSTMSPTLRLYEPPPTALTREVVLGFIQGSPLSVSVEARLVPVASDRIGGGAPRLAVVGSNGGATIPSGSART